MRSLGARRLVYSIGSIIVRTVISENNTGGKSDTLWSYAWGKDPATGSNVAYTSVNKSGHFLSFNMQNTQYPVNLPVIADLSTKTAKNPTNGGDGSNTYFSTNGGVSWNISTLPIRGDYIAECGSIIYAGGLEGLYTSSDNGVSWKIFDYNYVGGAIYSIIVNYPNIYIGSSGSSSVSWVIVSDSNASNKSIFRHGEEVSELSTPTR